MRNLGVTGISRNQIKNYFQFLVKFRKILHTNHMSVLTPRVVSRVLPHVILKCSTNRLSGSTIFLYVHSHSCLCGVVLKVRSGYSETSRVVTE